MEIGDGNTIIFWLDIWYKDTRLNEKMQFVDIRDREVTLSQVLNQHGDWDFSVLKTVVRQKLAEELEAANITLTADHDCILWNGTASRIFTCQSGYHILHKQTQSVTPKQLDWKCIWQSKLTNKMKHFLWLAIQDKLHTNSLRFKRQMATESTCY